MKLILTNSGTQPCVLNGFPGVSLTSGPRAIRSARLPRATTPSL